MSDGRLAVTLLFTGSLPLVTAHRPWVAWGFVFALLLTRNWVGRYEGPMALRPAAGGAAVMAAVTLSYGWLHPVWTTSLVPTGSVGRYCTSHLNLHNASWAAVDIDRIDAAEFTESPVIPTHLHLAPGGKATIMLRDPGGSGGGEFSIQAHYRVFGLALSEALPFHIEFRSNC